MPVTSIDSSNALTTKDAFAGNFGTLKGIKSADTTKLEYTALGKVTADNDVYTAAVMKDDDTTACGVYYQFYIDYMITAGKRLKVTATDVKAYSSYTDATTNTEVTSGSPTIAQAARVGIIAATTYTKGTGDTADTVKYADTGSEYTIAKGADTDYNLEELQALGYTGASEYKTGLTRLDEAGATFKNDKALATTKDGAFEYGSLNIYVWFDGTDYACTNAIFSQTLTMKLKFTVTD